MNQFFVIFAILAVIPLAAFILSMVNPEKMIFWSEKKSRDMACIYLVPFLIFGVIASFFFDNKPQNKIISNNTITTATSPNSSSISSTGEPSGSSSGSSSGNPSKAKVERPTKLKTFGRELVSGYYTAGIDFPVATYKIAAKKGTGTVSTSDGQLNVEMDGAENDSVKDIVITNGTVLSVSGLKVHITSKEKVDASTLKKRQNTTNKKYKLSSGSFMVGKDIAPGIYDLSAVKDEGNVKTDDGKFFAVMGTKSDGTHQQNYKHITLSSGQTLNTDITLKLTPSK